MIRHLSKLAFILVLSSLSTLSTAKTIALSKPLTDQGFEGDIFNQGAQTITLTLATPAEATKSFAKSINPQTFSPTFNLNHLGFSRVRYEDSQGRGCVFEFNLSEPGMGMSTIQYYPTTTGHINCEVIQNSRVTLIVGVEGG